MARSRRRFGPLFYLTAGLTALVIGSIPLWETGIQQFGAWRLTRRLREPAESVRREAVEGLVQLGQAATWWVIRASHDPDVRVRVLSCSILGRAVTDGDGRPAEALLGAVRDGDPSVRACAVGQLEHLIAGPGAANAGTLKDRAFRSLGAALDDESPRVRQAAVWSLWNLGPRARPAIGDLDRALDGADKALRPMAASALLRIDPTTTRPRVIAAMSALLADTSLRLEHWRTVQVLTDAQGQDATAAMLKPLLRHPGLEIRMQAINDLLVHCPAATSLKSLMIEGLTGDDVWLRDTAAVYLLKHEPGMATKALDAVAEQIVNPGEGGHLLWDLVKDVREASPGSLAPLAGSLVERLSRAREPDRRLNAILALGEIGPEARSAVPALLEQCRSGDLALAARAVEALVKVDPRSAAALIPSLLEWTSPGHERTVRLTAMAALRDLGPAATSAIPALIELADEDDLPIATGAIEALCRIDPERGAALKQAIERGAARTRED